MSPAELRAAGHGPRSERFMDTDTGQSMSRRQAQNEVLRGQGWRNRSEYERVMSDRRSKVIIHEVLSKHPRSRKGPLIGPSTGLAKDLRAAARGGWVRSQQGAWARALVKAGMRAPHDRWRVGFSPDSPRHRVRSKPL